LFSTVSMVLFSTVSMVLFSTVSMWFSVYNWVCAICDTECVFRF
jgi:hypothetical protein